MKLVALALVCAASLAACSTADVQRTCAETQDILRVAQPFLVAAPPEVRVAVTALGAGTIVCGSAQYASAREVVIGWLRAKGAKI